MASSPCRYRSAELSRIVPLITALQQEQWIPLLVVRVPDYEPIVPRPPLWVVELQEQLLGGLEHATKEAQFRGAFERAAHGCEPALAAWNERELSLEARNQALIQAVRGCDRDVDVDGVEALAVFRVVGSDRRFRALRAPEPLVVDQLGLAKHDTFDGLIGALARRSTPGQ
jgi:hypothetical protein